MTVSDSFANRYRDAVVAHGPTAYWRMNDLADIAADGYDAAVLARGDTVAYWEMGEASFASTYDAALLATSPVAYWKLDEASGSVTDSVGGYVGTVSGNPTYQNAGPLVGATSYAMDFDATGDWVDVPYAAALNPAQFTYSAWVKVDGSAGATRAVLATRNPGSTAGIDLFANTSNSWQARCFDGGGASASITSPQTATIGDWSHLGMTYDGATLRFYVNGSEVGSSTDTFVANTTADFHIGCINNAHQFPFDGKISRVAIHNTALSAATMRSLAAAGRGQLTDSTANGYHGVIGGTPTLGAAGPLLGAADTVYDWVSTTDYAVVPYSAALNPAQWTYMAWLYRDTDTGAAERIIDNRGPTTNYGTTFVCDALDRVYATVGNGAATVAAQGTTTMATGRWYHMAATYDGDKVRVYLNGVLETTSASVTIAQNTKQMNICRYYSTGTIGGTEGKLGKLSVHNACLTGAEIAAFANRGWPMDDYMGSYDGGYFNAPTTAEGAVVGDPDSAVDFDGSNDYGMIPYNAALNASTFSLVAWVKRDADSGGTEIIVDSRPSANYGYTLYVTSTDVAALLIGSGAGQTILTGSTTLAVDTWYMVSATHDGTNARLYVNGRLEVGPTAATLSVNTSAPTYIGRIWSGVTSRFGGKIDEVAIYGSKVLTADEIASLYDLTRERYVTYPDHATESGLASTQEPTLSVQVQRRDMTWEELGSGLSRGVLPENITLDQSFEGSIGGPSVANFVLSDTVRRGRPDLEHFTPVTVYSGSEPVWSGRVIRTPEVRDDAYRRFIEAQGWKEHLKDDPVDNVWCHSTLADWKDSSSLPGATWSNYQGGYVPSTDQWGIVLPTVRGGTIVQNRGVGVTLDLGPNARCERAVVTFTQHATASASYTVYLRAHDDADPIGSASYEDLDSQNAPAASTEYTLSGTAATPRRYVSVFIYYTGATASCGDDYGCKITEALVFGDASDESGDASILKASTVIGETLDSAAPLVSSDQSGITATSFVLPEFHTGCPGRMYPNEIVEAVNAYHGYQFLLSADPVPKPVFRAVPTTPVYVLGEADSYTFENPGTYDGSEVYSRVIARYDDATGQPAEVTVDNSTSRTAQIPNPSFASDTSGWSISTGSITRDTGVYESAAASGRLTAANNGFGVFVNNGNGSTATGLRPMTNHLFEFAWRKTEPWTSVSMYVVDSAGSDLSLSGQVIATADLSGLAEDTWHTLQLPFKTGVLGTARIAWTGTGFSGAVDVGYVDSVTLTELAEGIIQSRGFERTKVVEFRSRLTAAAATQIAQIILDGSQYPPLKGSIRVGGFVRRYGAGGLVHCSKIRVGEPILLADETSPQTGAIGRVGIIQAVRYDADAREATLTIDSVANYIDNLLARVGALGR